jgi:hypothetical protein
MDWVIVLPTGTNHLRENSIHFARLRPPIEGGDWNNVLNA